MWLLSRYASRDDLLQMGQWLRRARIMSLSVHHALNPSMPAERFIVLLSLPATEQHKPTWGSDQINNFLDLSLFPSVDFPPGGELEHPPEIHGDREAPRCASLALCPPG